MSGSSDEERKIPEISWTKERGVHVVMEPETDFESEPSTPLTVKIIEDARKNLADFYVAKKQTRSQHNLTFDESLAEAVNAMADHMNKNFDAVKSYLKTTDARHQIQMERLEIQAERIEELTKRVADLEAAALGKPLEEVT